VNTSRFPSLKAMAAKATVLGLSSGFYGNNCRCHQGEAEVNVTHYPQDAALTLESGFAGTKIDSCGNQRDMSAYASLLVESCGNGPAGTNPKKDLPPLPSYTALLHGSCPWSFYRVSVDLGPQFYSTVYNVNRALPFLNSAAPLSRPGCWAYADMSMVGVSVPRPSGKPPHDLRYLTPLEWRTHWAMWAVTSSPLIIGFDLTNATLLRQVWPIVANEEVLAVSQTWAGHPGRLVANASESKVVDVVHGSPGTQFTTERLPSWQAWAKPVGGGAVALLVVRVWTGIANTTGGLRFSLADLFGSGDVARNAPPSAVRVRDILAHTDNGTATAAVHVNLAALPDRGAAFVVLTPAQD
jgi:alpha-galactosidase